MEDRHHQAAGVGTGSYDGGPIDHPWWARSFARTGCNRCRRRLLPGELVLVEEDGRLRCELCGHQTWSRYIAETRSATPATRAR